MHVHQADDVEAEREFAGLPFELGDGRGIERARRQRTRRVAGVNTGLFDMLHDADDESVLAVAQAIDVDLDGIRQIAIEQQRVLAEHGVDLPGLVVGVARLDVGGHQLRQRLEQIVAELSVFADDLHCATAEHVRRPHHQRIIEIGGDEARLLHREGDAVLRLLQPQPVEHALETVAVFRKVDGVGRGAEDRHIGRFQRTRELQRGLAAELHDHAMQRAVLAFGIDDLEHVLGGQRLEIQPVGGVVVGRDRFRIAVDHDGLVARVRQREAGVAAAVVEFDALADTVRSAAEDDDLLAVGRRAFVGHLACEWRLVARIHIGGGGSELGGAGVDALVDRAHAERMAQRLDFGFGGIGKHREARVGEAHGFQRAHAERMRRQAAVLDLVFHLDDAAQLGEEPRIDLAGGEDVFIRPAEPHRLRHLQQAVRRRRAERGAEGVLVVALA